MRGGEEFLILRFSFSHGLLGRLALFDFSLEPAIRFIERGGMFTQSAISPLQIQYASARGAIGGLERGQRLREKSVAPLEDPSALGRTIFCSRSVQSLVVEQREIQRSPSARQRSASQPLGLIDMAGLGLTQVSPEGGGVAGPEVGARLTRQKIGASLHPGNSSGFGRKRGLRPELTSRDGMPDETLLRAK